MPALTEDLVTFAQAEQDAGDIAPWADLLRHMVMTGSLTVDESHWVATLYNTYDGFDSAFNALSRWPSPSHWQFDPYRTAAADHSTFKIYRERRNLHGGRVLKRLDSYVNLLSSRTEQEWLSSLVVPGDEHATFDAMVTEMRRVWGVGRQAAFEWAEFAGKCLGYPAFPKHAYLWESEGPRRSLETLYVNPFFGKNPTTEWLDNAAYSTMSMLQANGVTLPIWDFETLVCDFLVMQRGRYYVGKHLAALREEINGARDARYREALEDAWSVVIPEPWSTIPAGVDRDRLKQYRSTGMIDTLPWW